MIVDINLIKTHISHSPNTEYFTRKMVAVLQKQGQIEPLQVDENYYIFPDDSYGHDILAAANRLGWKTILIAVMERYEE